MSTSTLRTDRKNSLDSRVSSKMRFVGILLYFTGCLRLHLDNGLPTGIFRAWHPVTWLALLLMIIPCAVMGEKLTDVVPMRLSKFWVNNHKQLQWVTPFTRLNSRPKFSYAARYVDPNAPVNGALSD